MKVEQVDSRDTAFIPQPDIRRSTQRLTKTWHSGGRTI